MSQKVYFGGLDAKLLNIFPQKKSYSIFTGNKINVHNLSETFIKGLLNRSKVIKLAKHKNHKMDTKRQALLLLLVLTIFPFTIKASSSGGIAVYWGQNVTEGNLTSTCDTGNYEIVLLAFLSVFGEGRVPSLNFAGHCGGDGSPCTKLEPEIKHCQQKGFKILLSIGGGYGPYNLSSPEDAKNVSDYLYTNFLSGQSGPLGSVTLDGIDFDIEGGTTNLYWDDLARDLDNLRQQNR